MEQPFILCGLGRIGWRVLEYLRAAGLPVVVVDTRCQPADPRLAGARLVQGDCRQEEVLAAAGLAHARAVLIMTNDDLVNISTALMVRHLHADVRVVMRLFNQNLISRLGKTVANVFALSTATLTAPLFALTALTGQALGSIRLEGIKEGLLQVAELAISAASPLRGLQIAAVAERYGYLVLAHLPAGGPDRFLREVDAQVPLIPGDRLVVCGDPDRLGPMLEGGAEAFATVRWAGWLRRFGRVFWRSLTEVDLAVKICTAVLLGVILSSTLILYLGPHRGHPVKAFFRTIGLMATGADMHGEEYDEGWPMVFAGTLRIVGAALTAAFTGIFANYLLRARLGGALEVRRIPDSGHIIVCGLGNLGFRVVEELVKEDERVVVIEEDRDSRFVSTARRLGVAVLIGDATISEVLRQARVGQARAVIAATSNDLVNLEVALIVRELNPKQRVVLHMSDPTLADMLRANANVRLALSIPTLAAPAFVAALFGDRVQSVFLIEGRLFACVDLVVPPQDPCLVGQSARAIAMDYNLLPVAIVDPQGNLQSQPLTVRLDAGYRLIAISALPDLERLLRRQPVKNDYAIDVTGFPLPTRSWVAVLLGNQQGVTAEQAEQTLDQLPFCLKSHLTAGQAEDLLTLLRRERVSAKLRRLDGEA